MVFFRSRRIVVHRYTDYRSTMPKQKGHPRGHLGVSIAAGVENYFLLELSSSLSWGKPKVLTKKSSPSVPKSKLRNALFWRISSELGSRSLLVDGLPFHNPVRSGLPTIRPESPDQL